MVAFHPCAEVTYSMAIYREHFCVACPMCGITHHAHAQQQAQPSLPLPHTLLAASSKRLRIHICHICHIFAISTDQRTADTHRTSHFTPAGTTRSFIGVPAEPNSASRYFDSNAVHQERIIVHESGTPLWSLVAFRHWATAQYWRQCGCREGGSAG